ncbi:MAG: putative ATP:guanido phosphotransferase [Firmicutes bacterium]|nr:putative ATP:guanido phosphotransferase [Bacillota bacterium]
MSDINTILGQSLSPWMSGSGAEADIVLSSRVRLARNLAKVPFPNQADSGKTAVVLRELETSIDDLIQTNGKNYLWINISDLSPVERRVLVEKHIISFDLIQEPVNRALIVREDAAISIMVNEEDHLRIQSLHSGLDLLGALQAANLVDDCIESRHTFAFDARLGYLTACPTNLGTGLRASVMVHLPALVLTQQMNRVVSAATQLGLAVRGLYGEGTETTGNIFQISNQLTLGYNEMEIIDNLRNVVCQIVDQERTARKALLKKSKDDLSDRVWRSYGILRYARKISGQEALSMLSEVRLGTDLQIIEEIGPQTFNELLVATRTNFLQRFSGRGDLSTVECDQLRAQIIREKLQGV